MAGDTRRGGTGPKGGGLTRPAPSTNPAWQRQGLRVEIPREMLDRLKAGPVPRAEIAASLSTTANVSMLLSEYAKRMAPWHVVERHAKGAEISYSLRPVKPGEAAGQIMLPEPPRT
jgi:hypothetical protein